MLEAGGRQLEPEGKGQTRLQIWHPLPNSKQGLNREALAALLRARPGLNALSALTELT